MNSHLVTVFHIPLNLHSQVGLLDHLVACTVFFYGCHVFYIPINSLQRVWLTPPDISLSSQDQPVHASLDAIFVPFISRCLSAGSWVALFCWLLNRLKTLAFIMFMRQNHMSLQDQLCLHNWATWKDCLCSHHIQFTSAPPQKLCRHHHWPPLCEIQEVLITPHFFFLNFLSS